MKRVAEAIRKSARQIGGRKRVDALLQCRSADLSVDHLAATPGYRSLEVDPHQIASTIPLARLSQRQAYHRLLSGQDARREDTIVRKVPLRWLQIELHDVRNRVLEMSIILYRVNFKYVQRKLCDKDPLYNSKLVAIVK